MIKDINHSKYYFAQVMRTCVRLGVLFTLNDRHAGTPGLGAVYTYLNSEMMFILVNFPMVASRGYTVCIQIPTNWK